MLGLVLLAALLGLALLQFARSGQLGRSRWLPFLQLDHIRFLGPGLLGTLVATAVAAALSFPPGVVLALGRLSRTRPVRWASTGYGELFRGIPLLLIYARSCWPCRGPSSWRC